MPIKYSSRKDLPYIPELSIPSKLAEVHKTQPSKEIKNSQCFSFVTTRVIYYKKEAGRKSNVLAS